MVQGPAKLAMLTQKDDKDFFTAFNNFKNEQQAQVLNTSSYYVFSVSTSLNRRLSNEHQRKAFLSFTSSYRQNVNLSFFFLRPAQP